MSALLFGGRLGWLKRGWANGTLTPLICAPTAEELLRVLAYAKFKLSISDQKSLLSLYLPFVEIVALPAPLPQLNVNCRDESDEILLHLANAAGADFLVSGDGDLLAMRSQVPVKIITPRALQDFFYPE